MQTPVGKDGRYKTSQEGRHYIKSPEIEGELKDQRKNGPWNRLMWPYPWQSKKIKTI
jgi:hypothetical protein